MKIAIVGCGYVFDIYMRTKWAHPELEICGIFDVDRKRSGTVSNYYGIHAYPSYEALLGDPAVQVVVNLTSIKSHFEVIRLALEAGKHVYSEKPLTVDLDRTRQLFALARERGLVLTGAPCNLFCDAIRTARRLISDGAIGKPVLVYAELDDNPAHLMKLDEVRSPTGAPFPYAEELQEGCTIEHVAYHLVWLCAMFGPALSVTAFSKNLISQKTAMPLSPADTPDLSVACLTFANDVSARVTCSWVAPRDHSFRIIGDQGEILVDNVFHDHSPVHVERFSRVSLAARKAYTLRTQPLLGRRFGIGGQRQRLSRHWKSYALDAERGAGLSFKQRFVNWVRRREIYAQDKFLGIAEMARSLREDRPQPMPADFLLHLNELTLMIHGAGESGLSAVPATTFQPVPPVLDSAAETSRSRPPTRPRLTERLLVGVVGSLHKG